MSMKHALCRVITFPTELGWMAALGRNKLLWQLTFGHATPQAAWRALDEWEGGISEPNDWNPSWIADLTAFAAGQRIDLSTIDVDLSQRTPFQVAILQACRAIPYGSTATYGELAMLAGYPRAARAVGNVMAGNCVPLVIPCHRVVPSGGRLGGYSAASGVHTKLRLLEAEGSTPSAARPQNKFSGGKRLRSIDVRFVNGGLLKNQDFPRVEANCHADVVPRNFSA
jgi:methylated-DNA-[protein]-cysteine S-methyltransferase